MLKGCVQSPAMIAAAMSLLLCGSMAAAQSSTKPRGGSRLFREMQATGKPALVIAGSVDCVHCRIMAGELESNAALRPYVAQMFVVKVDTDSGEWPLLREEFRFDGTGIPAVFFVRADGKLLLSQSGRPTDLEGFLKKMLSASGTNLDAKTLQAMQREAGRLLRARKRDDWPSIVELVKLRSGTGSYAAAALAFDEAAAAVSDKAVSDAAAAESQLMEESTRLEGAMALMAAAKVYEGYEPAHTPVKAAIDKVQQDEAIAQLLIDAERLNEAAEFVSRRRRPDATRIYEQLIADRAGSAAARFAEDRLKSLQ